MPPGRAINVHAINRTRHHGLGEGGEHNLPMTLIWRWRNAHGPGEEAANCVVAVRECRLSSDRGIPPLIDRSLHRFREDGVPALLKYGSLLTINESALSIGSLPFCV